MKTIKTFLKAFYAELKKWGEAAAFATQHRNGRGDNY